MKEKYNNFKKSEKKQLDVILLIIIFTLVGFGVSILFSSTYNSSEFKDLGKQFQYIVYSLILCHIVVNLNLNFIRKNIGYLLGLCILLLFLTLLPGTGKEILGGARWIAVFNITVQPSEIVKVVLIIYLAHIFETREELIKKDQLKAFFQPFFIVILFCILIYVENDFSTSSFIFLIALLMFFLAGAKILYFLIIILLSTPILFFILSTGHRKSRVAIFLDPGSDPMGLGYQTNTSLSAIKNGGWFGVGVGNGHFKHILPEVQSDFIFAVVAEEIGFLGVMFVIFLFCAFAFRSYTIAYKAESKFHFYLVVGFTNMILLQFLINISVVSNLLPPTGLNLPFFSSGGSSFLMSAIMCALILNVSKYSKTISDLR